MYEQRVEKGTEHFEPRGPWVPTGFPTISEDPAERERLGPWYVVIDEIHAGSCRFTVDLWPEVDADGRLVFDTERTSLQWTARDGVHAVIGAARAESAASPEEREIAMRELRIGDVFAVWPDAIQRLGLTPPSTDAETGPRGVDADGPSGGLVDVTGAARIITRAAADAVGAGDLAEEDLRRLGITEAAVDRGQRA